MEFEPISVSLILLLMLVAIAAVAAMSCVAESAQFLKDVLLLLIDADAATVLMLLVCCWFWLGPHVPASLFRANKLVILKNEHGWLPDFFSCMSANLNWLLLLFVPCLGALFLALILRCQLFYFYFLALCLLSVSRACSEIFSFEYIPYLPIKKKKKL